MAGVAVSPDNVAYPLAKAARVYVGTQEVQERLGFTPDDANVALLWLNDRSKADVTLTQARAVSFGLGRLQFVTREGVQVLLSQAAGIVISLLIAFSLVALVAAGTMLAAGAHADVQRRLSAFGVQRALGFTPARIAALQATEAALVAVPAAHPRPRRGHAGGRRPVVGAARGAQRAAAGLGAVRAAGARARRRSSAIVVAAATWPAWRAARRSPAAILRGGDLARGARPGRAGARRPDRARRALLDRGARALAGLGGHDRGLRGRRHADARAGLPARAPAR